LSIIKNIFPEDLTQRRKGFKGDFSRIYRAKTLRHRGAKEYLKKELHGAVVRVLYRFTFFVLE
jgi:hypothetical protein